MPQVAVANPCAICLHTDESATLTFICCTTPNNIKIVHLECMAEAVAHHPAEPLRCVLCRSEVPLGEVDLGRLRARVPAPELVVDVVVDEGASLASFKRRSLHPMPLMMQHKVGGKESSQ